MLSSIRRPSDACLQYSQSFSTCPRTGLTCCNAALSAINAQNNRVSLVSSIELVWLCFSARTPRHIQCTKHSSALTDSKAKTLGSIFGKFNISATMCRTGNLKTGKSQNHQFSENKSPGKYTRYTVLTVPTPSPPRGPGTSPRKTGNETRCIVSGPAPYICRGPGTSPSFIG